MSQKILRVILDGPNGPAFNMAVDESLLRAVSVGQSKGPVLRFYQWQPYSISFGYAQKIDKIVDPAAAKKSGIGLVRRMTGGKAVFHAKEWTFSVVASIEWLDRRLHGAKPTFLNRFLELLSPLVQALRNIGIDARFAKESEIRKISTTSTPSAEVTSSYPTIVHCYQTAAGHSIYAGNKKLVGAAGIIRDGTMAVHGSLPIEPVELTDTIWRDRFYSRSWRSLNVAWLAELLPPTFDIDSLPRILSQAWAAAWSLEPNFSELSASELQAAQLLASMRYSRLDWKIIEPCCNESCNAN